MSNTEYYALFNRLDRIERILRAEQLHEPDCAIHTAKPSLKEILVNPGAIPSCNCWLSEKENV